MIFMNIERNEGGCNAGGKQKHGKIEKAVSGIIRVGHHITAEIIGHDHLAYKADSFGKHDDDGY